MEKSVLVLIAVVIIGLAFAIYYDAKDTEKRCAALMTLATSHTDTLQAAIACENIKAGKEMTWAIQSSGGYRRY